MSQPSSDFPGDPAFDDGSMFEATGEPGTEQPVAIAPQPVYRKQPFNIYSVMLILSFAFLLAAAIILMMDAGKYN